ncbi:hypothetical protein [Micromonospora costi]|uniref:Uncharacterized protein n=1 Tax=Micromonospora costi TaxID=1530042 RepID=A0A3B0A498_9ACTN|nr:hypothetical protein [Micromonospora costi]RKN55270.1 hypothetical protein D7193_11255 [Micromonospora costi]
MLSFAAVHTLAGCLLAADAEADALGWGTPATLLLIHDRPLPSDGSVPVREMRSVEFPLQRGDLLTDPAGLPALLHRLAAGLHHPNAANRAAFDAIIGLIRAAEPDMRLLAWAACYDDILTSGGQRRPARRIDAVDTDGRLYQLTHLRGEDRALLHVHDTPDTSIGATYPGVSALLAATTRHTVRVRGGAE